MTAKRDRSPSYPNIPLGTALDRLAAIENHFKRSPARPEKIGVAWGIKAKSYADRTAAALRYFGLIDYEMAENGRQIVISDEGRKYLRAQQDNLKLEVVKKAALRPTQIRKFWNLWGVDRPEDAACLDELVLTYRFSDRGAHNFLNVYTSTIDFAGLSDSDKVKDDEGGLGGDHEEESGDQLSENPPPLPPKQFEEIQMGERVLTTGLLSKSAGFRLLVNGKIGAKEITRLIAKLELDKEILSEQDLDDTRDHVGDQQT